MHAVLHTIRMDGVVVIGEGEKDEAPMLHNGEHVGDGTPPEVDIAVDPLEGTRLCALGMPSAIAVIALAERGAMFDPGPIVYMEKMAAGERYADLLDLDKPLGEIVEAIAERKGAEPNDVMAVVLDRPRHEEGIAAIRAAGGRCQLITDGDVSGALNASRPTGRPTSCGGSAARRRASSPRRRSSASAVRWSAGCSRATTRSARPRPTPATTSTGCSRTTTSSRARTCSSPPRA